MKVLVAGAGGYVGVPLIAELLKRGHSVIALDRYFFGLHRLGLLDQDARLTVLTADIRTITANMLTGVEAMIDLAGLSNDEAAKINPDLTRSINFEGGVHLAKVAKQAGVRRYVYSSSASVYGHGVQQHLSENDACRPQTLYAECKLNVEQVLRQLTSATFEVVIFRNATIFGLAPRMRFDLAINVMTLRAWQDQTIHVMGGEQWRPFIHVNDVIRALMLGLEEPADRVAGETFNVGSDDMNFQIKELSRFILDVIPNATVHRTQDLDNRNYSLSFAKIKQRLGFQPMTRVHEGVVEIKQALERGVILGDDPTSYTVQFYRSLLHLDQHALWHTCLPKAGRKVRKKSDTAAS